MKTLHTMHFTTRSNTHVFIKFKADHYSPDTNMRIELEEYINPRTGGDLKLFRQSEDKAPIANLARVVKKIKKNTFYKLVSEY